MNIQEFKKRYSYSFPKSLIAQHPARPRDSARLLVCDKKTGESSIDTFSHLGKYLPLKSVIVLNDTKVLPARLLLRKKTGGVVEVFYVREISKSVVAVLLNKNVSAGDELFLGNKPLFRVIERIGKEWLVELTCSSVSRPIEIWIAYGTVPLPPYIKQKLMNSAHSTGSGRARMAQQRRNARDYQTVFGKESPSTSSGQPVPAGSVAAPTASLHFTNRLLSKLRATGHTVCFVTLHVNLGTFAPVASDHLESGTLHSEYFSVPPATAKIISTAKISGRPIIPVGTTALRTLESAFDSRGVLLVQSGMTNLFIQEGYDFKIASGLITNFHVPESSLLALVCAFAGYDHVMSWYKKAIGLGFRLFSFGDGMLIL